MPDSTVAPAAPVSPAPLPAPDASAGHTHLNQAERTALANQLTDQAKSLRHDLIANGFMLGKILARLHHGSLYRATGAKTWEDYLSGHVEIGHTEAQKWMRIATHFDQGSVERFGVDVLDGLAKELDAKKQAVPADLSTVTVSTPEGDKHLADITQDEARKVFRQAHAETALAPADQTRVDTWTGLLKKIPQAHVSGIQTSVGARMTISFLVKDEGKITAAVAQAGSSAPTRSLVRKTKPAKSAKKKSPARPARSNKRPKPRARR